MKNEMRLGLLFIFPLTLFFSLNMPVSAQVSNYYWADMISSTSLDESYGIAVDHDGNAYVTGAFSGSADFGDTTLATRGGSDIFLVKYNSAGERLWVRQAGGKEDDESYAVHIGRNGYCYITGSFADTAYFESDTLPGSDDNVYYYDIFLAKYTLDGNLVWVTSAGENFWDEAFGIWSDLSGDIYITGSYWGTAKFDNISLSGLYGMGATDGFDIFIAKYDSAGRVLWANRMVERGWDRGSDVSSDAAGNIYVTGGFQTALLFGGFGGPSLTATGGNGDEDIFLVKYTSHGDFIWKSAAGGGGLDQARALALSDDNFIYLTGVFNDTATFDSTHQVISRGLNDLFLAKYDSLGNLLWVRGAGGAGDDGANDVITDKLGNIYICGYLGGLSDFDDLQITGGGLFIAKYDPEGKIGWVKQIDETSNLAKSLALLPAGDLVMTGIFENIASFGGTVLNGLGQTDIYITKLDTTTITRIPDKRETIPHPFFLAQNYPNPFNPSTDIRCQLKTGGHAELTIYNVLGKKIATLFSGYVRAGNHIYRFDGTNLASGLYYYQFDLEGIKEVKKMILIR